MAKRLSRHFIGIEQDSRYLKVAKKRIDSVTRILKKELLETKPKRNLPKVPFGNLIEYGFLKPGDTLFDAKRRFRAHVRVDGSLLAEGKTLDPFML